ncbi:hypothetical protein ACRE_067520 [Hapsidospora chrysogenum ATCC 11550]|uniref:Uncharacterized protein n=1 Tax=Hapsidospora chrysogenum (strain ATCC 11550 / CBS 779.69 / DSM 880 / IAM 14645 / JCM 23072 / IMI 49137) TaxID=857340 RepID=A0A086SZJ7_HAPC1|nr:hypothetical protein ACRE_067520 [Hapsidospora chrysogenum ATCC 11550]
MAHPSVEPPYGGPTAKPIIRRSLSRWQDAARRAASMQSIPESCTDLGRVLGRIPSLPNKIHPDAEWIEGYSTWKNCDTSCCLGTKRERDRTIDLRKSHPTTCKLSASQSFREWDGSPNNGIALLVAGWAYIPSASLAERQGLPMEYCKPEPSDSSHPAGPIKLHLEYAKVQERTWWRAVVAQGVGWFLAANLEEVSPWALSMSDLGVDIVGQVDFEQPPPTARQAATYLARFCHAFSLGNQSSAALAAALSIPLHATMIAWAPVTIELPAPSFALPAINTRRRTVPPDFQLLGYYMTLSLSTWALGPSLWSVFWEPDVPCDLAGAWTAPIATVLQPAIEEEDLELVAKIFSSTRVAPLWLGVALCGRGGIVESILSFLTKLHDYPFSRPDIDAAAWTGIPQSFLDAQRTQPSSRGTVTRADVWRLRHDCHAEYQSNAFSYTPAFGWPPFGRMRVEDVELEIRHHLDCSHNWIYMHWTWLPSHERDRGFSPESIQACRGGPEGNGSADEDPAEEESTRDLHDSPVVHHVSRTATESVFWWCCEQVERGFGGTIVPWRRGPDVALESAESPAKASNPAILKWLQDVQIQRSSA